MLQIQKRDGSLVSFNPSKILNRIKKSAKSLKVSSDEIFIKVITSIPTEGVIHTKELDNLIAQTAAPYTGTHFDYSKLASHVSISSFHKETNHNFYETMYSLNQDGIVHDDLIKIIEEYGTEEVQNILDYEKDFGFDYFAWKSLQQMYLLKNSNGVVVERPQQMYLRIALWVTKSLEEAQEFYKLLSDQLISCATPIMINSGTKNPQLASCFHENTKIFVKGKGAIKIKDVQVNDLVITHKNRYKKVLRTFKNTVNNRQIIKFKVHGSNDIICTDNHKFFSISKEQLNWNKENGYWNEISYLRVGDFIKSQNLENETNSKIIKIDLLPYFEGKKYEIIEDGEYLQLKSKWNQNNKNSKIEFENGRNCKKIRRYINLDETACKLIGMWYGDGSIIRKKGKPQGLNIISDVRQKEIINFIPSAFEKVFGLKVHIIDGKKECDYDCEWKTFAIYSTPLAEIFEEIFGAYFHGKRIPAIMYDLSNNCINNLIAGVITADGCITKKGRIIVSMKNEKFIEDLYYLSKNNGIKVSKGKNKNGTSYLFIPSDNDIINLVIDKYDDNRKNNLYNSQRIVNTINIDGDIYYRIVQKEIIQESPEFVYNMEVEDDNSYCVEGIVAKNCVLHYNDGDSREGLLRTLNDVSNYSSNAAGIGLCMSNIRSKDSRIKSSGGFAAGLLKYLKMINEAMRFFNQQGRRPGSAAIYIEPWHRDVFDMLDMKKNSGADELRARDLFMALWIPDNFMVAVENQDPWYLFCPNDILKAGLKPFDTIYGKEYEEEYQKAVELGIGKKINAQDLFMKIIEAQIETGTPYILFKDHVNNKSNHKNIGPVRQSNLCAEIVQATDEETTAICTLSSQVLKNYIKGKEFDFNLLHETTKKIVKALNKVIDINAYSTAKGKKGGLEQRAIAIGVQGLADVFFILDLVFISDEAKKLNKDIFETIYHAAITASNELCISGEYKPYKFFKGSPMSKGIFQFDMWNVTPEDLSGRWDWEVLRTSVKAHGVCNSLFTAQMPVASSAKITGSYEMTEPADSNLFNRRVIGGEFLIANKYLISDLEKLGIWGESFKNEIIANNGSIQGINFLKFLDSEDKNYDKKIKRIEFLLEKYKTVWEIKQKDLIDLATDRAVFIDQTQSMNIYMANPTVGKITSSHFYAWKKGLKTGSYYLRTKAISTGAKHLAVDMAVNNINQESEALPEVNLNKPSDSPFDCHGCSS